MYLEDHSISESRDIEFFEHVFPLKSDMTSEAVVENLETTSTIDGEHSRRMHKREWVTSSFGPDFVTTFIIDDS